MKTRLVQLILITTMIIAAGCGKQNNNENLEEAASAESDISRTEGMDSVEPGSNISAEEDSSTEDSVSSATDESASSATDESVTSETITTEADSTQSSADSASTTTGLLTSTANINLTDIDGNGASYTFTYDGEQYSAEYITDNWKIRNSYKINNESDMIIICQALIDEKPVHGRDMESYRTAEDMAYEWVIHNMAYELLSDDDAMKAHAKDVDFDPKDQNRSFDEIYEDRTGKEFNINDFLNRMN